ncbi:MAG: hypothetical protein FWD80_02995 [Propionibacteriaceae bacterium]|nr:hypothetical protein [Propionibacteriaceae bacterium]
MKINTVTGPIDTADLGATFMHEHVCCADWSLRANFGDRFFNFDEVVGIATAMYSKMKDACGVATVVDGTPINLGRDVRLIREVAERTGLNFVVSSGFYYQMEPALAMRPEDEIAGWLLDECSNGIQGTGILPGIMKAAVDQSGVTPYLHKVLSAIGSVAAQTDLPIFCHHNPSLRNGGDILDIFEAQGVAPNRVIMGHSGDTDELDYLQSLLNRGCYIGMDRFGYCDITLGLDRRVATIAALCERGWAHRMFVSHDIAAYLGMFGAVNNSALVGRPDYTLIHTQVLPALLDAGVTRDTFDEMMSKNAARFFEGQ